MEVKATSAGAGFARNSDNIVVTRETVTLILYRFNRNRPVRNRLIRNQHIRNRLIRNGLLIPLNSFAPMTRYTYLIPVIH